jgi:exopolyphosphatase/guanosine-5'-triphosphate,3'-diphosphate pyrophosphatase
MTGKRVAAVDCGTNSIRLLIADVRPDGSETEIERRMRIVRLGQGVDATGRLGSEALARTFAACDEYAELITEFGATELRFVATSATRDASNREEFADGVRARLGVEPEVVTGDEEAGLSFRGATRAVAADTTSVHPTPYLVVDIGGGSTEFVLGAEIVTAARSVDIGCVRMTERHFQDDLAAQTVDLSQARTLVGVAGSVTTIAALALGLEAYDRERVHLSRIPVDDVRRIAGRLLAMSHAERAAHAVIHPGRVDVIGAGALVLVQVMDRLGLPEIVVSEHDILDGIALSLA